MRSLNLNQEILNFYLIDDFNTEDKNIIVKELENRLSNIKNLELEIGSGNGKFIVELALPSNSNHSSAFSSLPL